MMLGNAKVESRDLKERLKRTFRLIDTDAG